MSQCFYRTSTQLLWMVSLVFCLISARESAAETFTLNFTGVVDELDVNSGLFGPVGQVVVGDSFTGHLSYEVGPGNPDQLPADPEHGIYEALEFSVDGSPLTFQNPRISVTHRFLPSLPPAQPLSIDRFQVSMLTPGASHPTAQLVLRGSFGAAFTDDSLPTALDLSVFDTAAVAGIVAVGIAPAPTIDDRGTLTAIELIPEPTTLGLTGLGLLGCTLLRRRARRS